MSERQKVIKWLDILERNGDIRGYSTDHNGPWEIAYLTCATKKYRSLEAVKTALLVNFNLTEIL